MEVIREKPPWLEPQHPNYERWKRGRELSLKRAQVVKDIISSSVECMNLFILDIGSGEGGTSSLLAEDNKVISYDLNLIRLKRQQSFLNSFPLINGRAENLPFSDAAFDCIILQDVIEHIEEPDRLVGEMSRVLKKDGFIYLSTPNRFSIFNIVSDPHWGLPLLALFKREQIKKYFLRYFRKSEYYRNDIAQLLSLRKLKKLVNEFELKLKTQEAVKILELNPDGILWSNFHLLLLKLLKISGLITLLKNAASNKEGFRNNYFTPTFYAILKKDTK